MAENIKQSKLLIRSGHGRAKAGPSFFALKRFSEQFLSALLSARGRKIVILLFLIVLFFLLAHLTPAMIIHPQSIHLLAES